jgi:6-phosphogluconolactonase
LSYDNKWLLAVNGGSNSISAFMVNDDGSLTLTSTVSSGGMMPVSVDIYDNYVYVVNAGTDNIMGFMLSDDGMLSEIAGSNQPLSGDSVGAAQISFNHDGTALYVTEKMTNMITSFSVDANGVAGAPMPHVSAGMTPFGFEFAAMGKMVVTNAAGGAPGASSASMYQTDSEGGLALLDGPVANNQSAACWIAFGDDMTIGYVTNTASNTISSYATNGNDLQLLHAVAASSGDHPIDIIVSGNNKYVYNINAFDENIGIYTRKSDGTLMNKGYVGGVPMSAAGLVAF